VAGTKERRNSDTTGFLMHSKKNTMTRIQSIIMAICFTFCFCICSCSDYLTTAKAEINSEMTYTISDVITIHDTITVVIKEEIPVTFNGIFYGGLYITGKGEGIVPELVVEDNKHVATNHLKASFEVTVKASPEMEASEEPQLLSTEAVCNGSEHSYKYNVCSDCWTVSCPTQVSVKVNNDKTITRSIPDAKMISLALYNAGENKFEHLAAVTLQNVIQDTDVQKFVITKPQPVEDVEFDADATVKSATESQLYAYPTLGGQRTGEKVALTSDFGGTLTAGKVSDRISNGTASLTNTNAVINGTNANFTYALDNKTFDESFVYSVTTEAIFTYSRNGVEKTVTRPIKADVTVKSTNFSVSGTTYSNTATLYANGFAIATATQQFKVNKPADYTIPGYRLVRADQTDRYDLNRTTWESTPICAWFENISDDAKTLFVAYDENTGAEIHRENTSGYSLPADKLAMVYNSSTSKFEAGYVKISETYYKYRDINSDLYTTVSVVSDAVGKLRNPYQGSGVYDEVQETTTFSLTNGKKLVLK